LVQVHGVITDDGRPDSPGYVTSMWSKLSGPGTVDFADEFSDVTAVAFSEPGTYLLRLMADDGQVKVIDQVTIMVQDIQTVMIQATDDIGSEFGQNVASFAISRAGATSSALTVHYSISGTASNGVDYGALSTSVVIPAGASTTPLLVIPIPDDVAEGDESVTIALDQDIAYTLGALNSATVTLQDKPWDEWRHSKFTAAELIDPSISGESADAEGDHLPNLLEYAFNLEPKSFDSTRGFSGRLELDPNGEHLVVTFKRRKAPTDLLYQVQVTSDLVDWQTGAGVVQELLPAQDDGNGITETVRFRVINAVNQTGQRFVRLRVNRQ